MLYTVVLFAIIISACTLIFLKANVVIEFHRKNSDDNLVISFYALGGLVKKKYEIPLIDLDKSGIKLRKVIEKGKKDKAVSEDKSIFKFLSIFGKFKAFNDFYCRHKDIICKIKKYLVRKIILKEFNLEIIAGTGDAFSTGILGGLVWTVTGIVISFLANNFRGYKRNINIRSDFNEKILNIDLFCIFSIRIVHIILVSLMIFIYKKGFYTKKSNQTIGGGINV